MVLNAIATTHDLSLSLSLSLSRLAHAVTQDDCLAGFLTVQETLQFYADLKLPSSISQAQKERKVLRLINKLGLDKVPLMRGSLDLILGADRPTGSMPMQVRHSRVGTQFQRGISGGEKKRLSVGCELITDPSTCCSFDKRARACVLYHSLTHVG